MRSLRCLVGLHQGTVEPAHCIDQEVSGRAALVCSRCGAVID